MTQPFLPIYIGYDIREHAAYQVCASSLVKPIDYFYKDVGKPTMPLRIKALAHRELRREGLFTREWKTDATGQMWDLKDGRPFSTEFSHSRFLVPHLGWDDTSNWPVTPDTPNGCWAVFVDCDFMFINPITRLLPDLDPAKAIYVVKHDFSQAPEGKKMDGMMQARYPRKLWSSLVIWNLNHPKVLAVDWIEAANEMAGGDLHAFPWFTDDEIGALPETWNWIPGHSARGMNPDAVHWSLGGPWLEDYRHADYATRWLDRYGEIVESVSAPGAYDFTELFPLL